MGDLDQSDLHGPVRTVRTHFAEWNPDIDDWRALKSRAVVSFRPDGKIQNMEYYDPDGSVVRQVRVYEHEGRITEEQWWVNDVLTNRVLHTYDAQGRQASSKTIDPHGAEREVDVYRYDNEGRKTKVSLLALPKSNAASYSGTSCGIHYAVEGTDFACSVPGATTSTTGYDERERPSQVTFYDANHGVVCRVVFSRDTTGRVLSERMEFNRFGAMLGPAIDASMPSDEQASLITALEANTFLLATYAYDEKGRRVASVRRMGQLSEERVTVRYDELDNPVEQVTVDLSCDVRMDNGIVKSTNRPPHVEHVRFEYQYDAYGNWTERIVWHRVDPNADERRSNIERRTIAYYT
jgi:hypothetical protein